MSAANRRRCTLTPTETVVEQILIRDQDQPFSVVAKRVVEALGRMSAADRERSR